MPPPLFIAVLSIFVVFFCMKPSSSISIEPLSARAYVCGSLSCLRFVLFSLFPLYFILFTRSPSLIVGRSLYRKRSFFSTFFFFFFFRIGGQKKQMLEEIPFGRSVAVFFSSIQQFLSFFILFLNIFVSSQLWGQGKR